MTPILPTSYLGNLEYFYYLVKHDQVVIDLSETYQKQTFRNRCVIVGPNGTLNLSVPVERPYGKQTKTWDVAINYSENWQQVHWRTLESCYSRSPYFEFYADQLKDILLTKHQMLANLNRALLNFMIDKVGLTCTILDKVPEQQESIDLKTTFTPKRTTNFKNYPYLQTFIERHGHIANLSIADLLFNEGPNSICILEESQIINHHG